MNISLKLNQNFVACLNKLREKYGEKFETMNGFHNANLNFTDFIDHFVDSKKVADATIDANANSTTYDVNTLMSDMMKPHTKLLAFNKIFFEITKKYGLATAEAWLENEWNGAFYLHNSSNSSFKSYCFAYDLDTIVEKGLFFIDKFKSGPAQHLTTFNDHVLEFVSWASNRTSGAVGLPSYFVYSYYFWNKDVKDGFFLKDPEYYRRQCFQKFVYDLNQPYLRVNECSFSNITIMDRNYLSEIFGDRKFPNGEYVIDHIEGIIEHQKVFMKTVAEVRKRLFMTFPVITYSLLYQDGKFVDEEFARWCNKHNMEWYDANFYVGNDVSVLSNCCFDGKQKVLIKSQRGGVEIVDFATLSKLQFGEEGFSIFHNGNWENGKLVQLPKRPMFKITTENGKELFVTDNHIHPTEEGEKTTLELTTEDSLLLNKYSLVGTEGKSAKYEEGQFLGRSVKKIDDLTLGVLLYPIEFRLGVIEGLRHTIENAFESDSTELLERIEAVLSSVGYSSEITVGEKSRITWTRSNGHSVRIKSIEAYDSNDEFVYCFEMEDKEQPYFTLPNGIITHNCRLLSNTKDKKLSGFINSIGGTSLKIGSLQVNTVNLQRIALEAKGDKQKYLNILVERLKLCVEVLDVVRDIITRNVEKGLLPNYKHGLIDMNRQYNTIGITALYEAVREFGLINSDEFGNKSYSEEGLKFASEVLNKINEFKDSLDFKYSLNIEAVPAERANAVLCKKDNELFPNQNEDFIYSNQWIPLMESCTLSEKIKLGSLLDKECGGGQISHINLQGKFSNEEQSWELLNKIAASGLLYFAYNIKTSVCEHGHGFFGEVCPTCGGPKTDEYSRVVGFLTPKSSYSKERRQEFEKRKWFKID